MKARICIVERVFFTKYMGRFFVEKEIIVLKNGALKILEEVCFLKYVLLWR